MPFDATATIRISALIGLRCYTLLMTKKPIYGGSGELASNQSKLEHFGDRTYIVYIAYSAL